MFSDAEWYDRSINWSARLGREIPVFTEVFGPPAEGGILDAGCGTGRQACALAAGGYRVVGADASEDMLAIAHGLARGDAPQAHFVHTPYANLFGSTGGGFDGLYCIANSLPAAGTRDAVHQALGEFARCLRPGGHLFLQLLNFPPMRAASPYVLGPRIARVGGVEYVSTRVFNFAGDQLTVTNVTLWRAEDAWKSRSHSGTLYPISLEQLQARFAELNLHIDHTWGSYAREPFDPEHSTDLILVAHRAD